MNRDLPCMVLLVDDDASFRDSMRRLLWTLKESMPTCVLDAASGEEALAGVTKEPVDCVLLDHRMPGGTGVEWIAKLLQAREHLAIVMVTGEGDEQTAVSAMRSGAMDYLVKGTVTAASLQRAVMNAVEKVEMQKTIAKQRKMLQTAERLQAMIASMGSVCQHLEKPMADIALHLDVLQRQELHPSLQNRIQQCVEAVNRMNAIMGQMQPTSSAM